MAPGATNLKKEPRLMKNLPKLDAAYWILMILCTTMGELIGNLISRNFELGYTQGAIVEISIFFAATLFFLIFNLKSDIFYWLLILVGNIGGTNLACSVSPTRRHFRA